MSPTLFTSFQLCNNISNLIVCKSIIVFPTYGFKLSFPILGLQVVEKWRYKILKLESSEHSWQKRKFSMKYIHFKSSRSSRLDRTEGKNKIFLLNKNQFLHSICSKNVRNRPSWLPPSHSGHRGKMDNSYSPVLHVDASVTSRTTKK